MAKRNKGRNLIIILVALIAILVVVAVMSKKGKSDAKTVTVETVEARTIIETVGASGRIYPEIEIKISSDVSGEIIELYVEEGDSVTKGQLLAKIQPDTYLSAVDRAQAAVNSSKAQVANSKASISQVEAQRVQMQVQYENTVTVFNRNKKLFDDGVISQADYDNAMTQMKTAKANLASAEASLESARQSAKAAEFSVESAMASAKEAKDNLNRTSLYAPASGIVSTLNVEKGERIVGNQMMAGTEIMRIANLKYLEVQVDVSENDVLRVSLGDKAEIEVDAYLDRTFTGKITEIANSAQQSATGVISNDQVTNFTVKVRINPNSYSDLVKKGRKSPFRPGMSATVDIITNELENTVSLPISAVTTREDKKDDEKKSIAEANINEVIFVYQSDTAKMVKVKTGIQDDEFIQILEGAEIGQEVIVGPYNELSRKLDDGDLVKREEKKGKKKKKDDDED